MSTKVRFFQGARAQAGNSKKSCFYPARNPSKQRLTKSQKRATVNRQKTDAIAKKPRQDWWASLSLEAKIAYSQRKLSEKQGKRQDILGTCKDNPGGG